MSFSIPKAQQKLFIEHFMKQVLDLSVRLVAEGKAEGSPGETIFKVGQALIRQLYQMDEGAHDDA